MKEEGVQERRISEEVKDHVCGPGAWPQFCSLIGTRTLVGEGHTVTLSRYGHPTIRSPTPEAFAQTRFWYVLRLKKAVLKKYKPAFGFRTPPRLTHRVSPVQ
jgi:hypothetical protein